MPKVEEPEPQVSQNEMNALLRVFNFMSDFAPKHRFRKELQPRDDRLSKIAQWRRAPDQVRIVDEAGNDVPHDVLAAEEARLLEEKSALQAQIDAIDARPEAQKLVHPRDLQQALAFLGKHTEKVRRGEGRKRSRVWMRGHVLWRTTRREGEETRSPPFPFPPFLGSPSPIMLRRRRSRT
jgi:hypothetical protein